VSPVTWLQAGPMLSGPRLPPPSPAGALGPWQGMSTGISTSAAPCGTRSAASKAAAGAEAAASEAKPEAGDGEAFEAKEREEARGGGMVAEFNQVSEANPMALCATFMASRLSSFYALAYVLPPVPELALGWMVARVTAKLRQPINLALAAMLCKVFPVLSEIKASALLGFFSMPVAPLTTQQEEDAARAAGGGGGPQVAPAAPGWMERGLVRVNDGIEASVKWVQAPIDRYGMAWYISSKGTMFVTMVASYMALKSGVDVTSLMAAFWLPLSIQEAGGSMGSAFLANTVLLPLHLKLAVSLTPRLASLIPDPASLQATEERLRKWSESENAALREYRAALVAKAEPVPKSGGASRKE